MARFICFDGIEKTSDDVASSSGVYRSMLAAVKIEGVPPNIPKITAPVFDEVHKWCKTHRKFDNSVPHPSSDETRDLWKKYFFSRLSRNTILDLVHASYYLRIEGLLDASCKHEATERVKTPDKSSPPSRIEELNDRINLEVHKERCRILIQAITPHILKEYEQLKRDGLIDSNFHICHPAYKSAAGPPAKKRRKKQDLREERTSVAEEEIKLLEKCARYCDSGRGIPLDAWLGLPSVR